MGKINYSWNPSYLETPDKFDSSNKIATTKFVNDLIDNKTSTKHSMTKIKEFENINIVDCCYLNYENNDIYLISGQNENGETLILYSFNGTNWKEYITFDGASIVCKFYKNTSLNDSIKIVLITDVSVCLLYDTNIDIINKQINWTEIRFSDALRMVIEGFIKKPGCQLDEECIIFGDPGNTDNDIFKIDLTDINKINNWLPNNNKFNNYNRCIQSDNYLILKNTSENTLNCIINGEVINCKYTDNIINNIKQILFDGENFYGVLNDGSLINNFSDGKLYYDGEIVENNYKINGNAFIDSIGNIWFYSTNNKLIQYRNNTFNIIKSNSNGTNICVSEMYICNILNGEIYLCLTGEMVNKINEQIKCYTCFSKNILLCSSNNVYIINDNGFIINNLVTNNINNIDYNTFIQGNKIYQLIEDTYNKKFCYCINLYTNLEPKNTIKFICNLENQSNSSDSVIIKCKYNNDIKICTLSNSFRNIQYDELTTNNVYEATLINDGSYKLVLINNINAKKIIIGDSIIEKDSIKATSIITEELIMGTDAYFISNGGITAISTPRFTSEKSSYCGFYNCNGEWDYLCTIKNSSYSNIHTSKKSIIEDSGNCSIISDFGSTIKNASKCSIINSSLSNIIDTDTNTGMGTYKNTILSSDSCSIKTNLQPQYENVIIGSCYGLILNEISDEDIFGDFTKSIESRGNGIICSYSAYDEVGSDIDGANIICGQYSVILGAGYNNRIYANNSLVLSGYRNTINSINFENLGSIVIGGMNNSIGDMPNSNIINSSNCYIHNSSINNIGKNSISTSLDCNIDGLSRMSSIINSQFACMYNGISNSGRHPEIYNYGSSIISLFGASGCLTEETADIIGYDKNIPNLIGNNSVLLGGRHNALFGDYSIIIGGWNNIIGSYAKNTSSENKDKYPYLFTEQDECIILGGYNNIGYSYQTIMGHYNKNEYDKNDDSPTYVGSFSGTTGSALIIGNGNDSGRSNCFRIQYNGNIYTGTGGNYNTSNADYAEFIEWQDGNPNNEDRVGYFACVIGKKMRIANSKDNIKLIGVVSGTPGVVGDAQSEDWKGKYLTDIFGRLLTQTVHHDAVIKIDKETNKEIIIKPKYDSVEYILNPEYDKDKKYIPREQRPEYDCFGMVGKLIVIDDGTCEEGQFCFPNDNGIATKADDGFYVMERLDDSHVRILLLR